MLSGNAFDPSDVWVRNSGAACTSAALLAALGLFGAHRLPPLAEATRLLGASVDYGAPALGDYLSWPGRRAPLDLRVERLAAGCGIRVRSRTGLALPGRTPALRPGQVLVVHLLYGQEAPGRYGCWGFRPFDRRTWDTGGHSVVLLGRSAGGWRVLDPNWEGVQDWPRPGVAVTITRLRATA